MQRHTLSVTRRHSHEGFTARELCWPARKSIPKLQHCIGNDRVEVAITVDKACQALPDDVKERIECGKRSIAGSRIALFPCSERARLNSVVTEVIVGVAGSGRCRDWQETAPDPSAPVARRSEGREVEAVAIVRGPPCAYWLRASRCGPNSADDRQRWYATALAVCATPAPVELDERSATSPCRAR